MGRMTLYSGVTENCTSAIIEMHEDGRPLAQMIVDAATLEGIIEQLGRCREAMSGAVPENEKPGGGGP